MVRCGAQHRVPKADSLDIEWKLIYVGSAESEDYDQELDSCMVGPVPVGTFRVSIANADHRCEFLRVRG